MTQIPANFLRGLAEEADGFRGKPLALRPIEDGTGGWIPTVAHDPTADDPFLLNTPIKGRAYGEIAQVFLHARDMTHFTIDGNAYPTHKTVDSIFWTQSSAEKFLVPYYSSFCDEAQMDELQQACTNQVEQKYVYALIHRYPTDYDYLARDDRDPPGGPPGGPGRTLRVLWALEGTDQFRLTTLREYLTPIARATPA
jgi:hypothetical protein